LRIAGNKEKIATKYVNLSRKQSRLFCAFSIFLSFSQDSNKNQHENKFLFFKLELTLKLLFGIFLLSCPRSIICELEFRLRKTKLGKLMMNVENPLT
jgi:hypothetical protein